MTRLLATLLFAVLSALWLAGNVLAQTEPRKSPLGLPMPPAASQSTAPSASAGPPGVFDRAWNWVLGMQQKLNRDMASAVKDLKTAGGFNAAWVLGFISFMYGVLHAAGPGHGKAVISSYVLANERTVRRGIFLSFLAALFQAISAIAIVGVLAIALNATSMTIKSTEMWIETLSWALVAAIGAWLLFSQIRKLVHVAHVAAPGRAHAGAPRHHSGCGHAHHGDTCCGHSHAHEHAHQHGDDHGHDRQAAMAHDHVCDHSHGHDECCGHAHMPSPRDLEGDLTWTKALAIAGSVGIRPCTGAILVLIFALSQGIFWAGVFATFAMALGTALTTSALAALAVGSKELATRYAGEGSRWADRIGTAAGLAGSVLLIAMGTAFFLASLNGSAPL